VILVVVPSKTVFLLSLSLDAECVPVRVIDLTKFLLPPSVFSIAFASFLVHIHYSSTLLLAFNSSLLMCMPAFPSQLPKHHERCLVLRQGFTSIFTFSWPSEKRCGQAIDSCLHVSIAQAKVFVPLTVKSVTTLHSISWQSAEDQDYNFIFIS
jgi:hypothetical protein